MLLIAIALLWQGARGLSAHRMLRMRAVDKLSTVLFRYSLSHSLFWHAEANSGWRRAVDAYDTDLDRNPANFQPLTPLSFLERAAEVFPDHTAIIHGGLSAQLRASSTRAPGGSPRRWRKRGIKRGDTVSVMLANTPAMLEAHYGVPMTGAVLNTLNTRLDAAIIAFIARPRRGQGADHRPRIFQGDEGGAGARQGQAAGHRLRRSGIRRRRRAARRDRIRGFPRRRRSRISPGRCRTTNGTRSRSTTRPAPPAIPKGVVYHHRGAYLLAVGNVVTCGMGKHPVYLWTLPMFHCNGWCFPWSISVVAGTHVCLRAVRAAPMYDAIADAQGHASVRRADRDVDAAQRAGRREEAAAARRSSSSPPRRRRRRPCSRR